ncbi:hypothetical protein WJX74_002239 [Apatococcus lobatus]|uniref:Uncharacterized protein n=1 Tax=Apatococcus lobatus TaxID=904363 RepID=A0AAW1QNW4_9CHLO
MIPAYQHLHSFFNNSDISNGTEKCNLEAHRVSQEAAANDACHWATAACAAHDPAHQDHLQPLWQNSLEQNNLNSKTGDTKEVKTYFCPWSLPGAALIHVLLPMDLHSAQPHMLLSLTADLTLACIPMPGIMRFPVQGCQHQACGLMFFRPVPHGTLSQKWHHFSLL